MNCFSRLECLYLANASVLIAHEIDSAYWKEWELFHIPGGIQVFVLLHLLLLPAVMIGYREVAGRRKYARHATIALAVTGLFAAIIHGVRIVSGDTAFTLPASQFVLLMAFILSALQLWTVKKYAKHID